MLLFYMVSPWAMGDLNICCGSPSSPNAIILYGFALGHGRPNHMMRKPKCTKCYYFTWSCLGQWETKLVCRGSPTAPNAIILRGLALGHRRPNHIILEQVAPSRTTYLLGARASSREARSPPHQSRFQLHRENDSSPQPCPDPCAQKEVCPRFQNCWRPNDAAAPKSSPPGGPSFGGEPR